jgi:hypothetical protein
MITNNPFVMYTNESEENVDPVNGKRCQRFALFLETDEVCMYVSRKDLEALRELIDMTLERY